MNPLAVDCPTCGRHAGEMCIWIPLRIERKDFHTARVGRAAQKPEDEIPMDTYLPQEMQ